MLRDLPGNDKIRNNDFSSNFILIINLLVIWRVTWVSLNRRSDKNHNMSFVKNEFSIIFEDLFTTT